jgi:predicted dienelactone hydrolase
MFELRSGIGLRAAALLLAVSFIGLVPAAKIEAGGEAVCGDANGDSLVDLGDAVHVLAWLFRGGEAPRCGGLPCVDVNSDSTSDLADAVYLLEWLFLGGEDPACSAPQPASYEVGRLRLSFGDSPGSRGEIPVDVFYPALEPGERGAAAPGRFPLVVFGHGYNMETLDYAYIWETLVPAGYVFAMSDRLSDAMILDLDEYALDLQFVLSRLKSEGETRDSILYGHLDGSSAFMGHSAGGGASVLASSRVLLDENQDLRTAVVLAPLGMTVSPVLGLRQPTDEAGDIDAPVLVIEGEKDCTTPPVLHSRRIFESLPEGGGSYLTSLPLGDHCGFSDEDGPTTASCGIAEVTLCNPFFPFINFQGETLGSVEQTRIVGELALAWLNRHLRRTSANMDLFEAALSEEPVTWRRR